MSVVVFAENWDGKFKKASFETVSYAARTAEKLGTDCAAVVIGKAEGSEKLKSYGADRIYEIESAELKSFNNYLYAEVLQQVAEKEDSSCVILSGSFNGKAIQSALAVNMEASLITNVVELPSSTDPLVVRRSAFSSKGFVDYEAQAGKVIISIMPNSIGVEEVDGKGETATLDVSLSDDYKSMYEVIDVDRAKGKVLLPEAEIVVSGGRGMKGPENWKMLEELAESLDAALACSKPVSDMQWRPHSEHVGQTGIAINPNLYLAVGISGAIQHLAGVSNSRNIVVINNDPEAPFFKSADYGIVGDAFEVVPKLTEAVKAFKAKN